VYGGAEGRRLRLRDILHPTLAQSMALMAFRGMIERGRARKAGFAGAALATPPGT
jgi:hypothetical protein